ncbi:hypothetical protein KPH14_013100 [Odynerus spinipes]|uniref:Uncharacterized protein n=1 Tax=Odynerus spinipes TaxID=1348599 RepID=A0AAD9R7Z0_9HYME|nr:hypothetical protein KPH14_013100 [Odynerus spinipes]
MLVQKSMTSFLEINSLMGNLISLLVALVVARFSDRFGRKILLIVGLAGRLIYTNGLLIVSLLPTLNVYFVSIFATLPSSFFGGETFIFSNAFAYIADTTTLKNRSSRILILELAYLTAIPVGLNCGVFFFDSVFSRSYALMFVSNIAITAIALIYALFRLEYTTMEDRIYDSFGPVVIVASSGHTNAAGRRNRRRPLFDLNCCAITETLTRIFCGKLSSRKEIELVDDASARRDVRDGTSLPDKTNDEGAEDTNHLTVESNRAVNFLPTTLPSSRSSMESHLFRKKLWLLLACTSFYAFHRSERNVTYMYTQVVFDWNMQQFTFYKTILSICFLNGILLFAILVRVTPSRLRDEYVVVVGCISHICGRFCYMGARTQQVFLVGGIVSGLGPTAAACIKSLVSKITPFEMRGALMARAFDLSYFYSLTVVTQMACIICVVTYAYLDYRWPASSSVSSRPIFPSSRSSSRSASSISLAPMFLSQSNNNGVAGVCNEYYDRDGTAFVAAKRNQSLRSDDSTTIVSSLSLSNETPSSNASSLFSASYRPLPNAVREELFNRLTALSRETYV